MKRSGVRISPGPPTPEATVDKSTWQQKKYLELEKEPELVVFLDYVRTLTIYWINQKVKINLGN